MNLASVDFLLSPAGRALLDEAAGAYQPGHELALGERLRARFPADHVAAALTQVVLRHAAEVKFGTDASSLLLTADGLEQATHRRVAAHRARRIAASGPSRLVDLTCGIGADLLACARAGVPVFGIDRDPVTAALAQANLGALGLPGRTTVADAATFTLDDADTVFLDPARRGGSGRVFDPDRYSPPWSVVERLLTRAAAVKLAPGLPHQRVPADAEAEWVSLDGRLREAVVWSEALAGTVHRRATVLRTGQPVPAELTDLDDPGEAAVRPVGGYVCEPDDAVVRAHLVTAYAATVEGWLLDEHLAYVSTDARPSSALGRGYRVLDVLPFREKALRAALRERDIGVLTIKKRGVQVTPEALRERLRLRGSRTATIILTRTPSSAQVLLVEPLD